PGLHCGGHNKDQNAALTTISPHNVMPRWEEEGAPAALWYGEQLSLQKIIGRSEEHTSELPSLP
ncbi:hypothetical protein ACQJ25_27390, partial [Klebsiella pneumoniae]|uniref:hypothetical protein n=1 Tax=Klebsiella pneumoniae TaxID=573 RepID=UPI003CFC478B